jgi:1,4-dihydroxy-2-naphthoate octaprenyltransferase
MTRDGSGSRLGAYAAVARAPFLALPVTLIVVGAGAAVRQGAFDPLRTALALVGLVALHVAVNSFNEASDYRTRIDFHTERTPFSGGSGTLPAGVLPPRAAVFIGALGSAIGLAIGAWFLWEVGWKLAPIIVLGGLAVLFYTDVLARANAGELLAGFGLGAGPVLGTVLVQAGELWPVAYAASVPPFLLTFNLLLLNEFPDEEADRRGGRRNLVLLLGRPNAARLYAAFALFVPAVVVAAVIADLFPVPALLAAVPTILAAKPLKWALLTPEEPVPHPALAANVIWILATNAVLGVTLMI